MSKSKKSAATTTAPRPASPPIKDAAPIAPAAQVVVHRETTREYVESLVIAFLLAFLFRSFEAEGYQIPTGSMGPTLMGRHKDVACDQCGYRYQVGSSSEIDQLTGAFIPEGVVTAGTCPVCRFSMPMGPNDPTHETISYAGDRIAVNKVRYSYGPPSRWDVAVFKCPERARDNYIKRIVGMPNEIARIYHGDIYTGKPNEQGFTIERKPPDKVLTLKQIVYDNDYLTERERKSGWPDRWQADVVEGVSNSWEAAEDGHSFSCQAGDAPEWVRYHNFVPSFNDWNEIDRLAQAGGQWPTDKPILPQLITDFYAYNTSREIGAVHGAGKAAPPDAQHMGLHWVGDLLLECEIESTSDTGQVVLELVEGSERFQCAIDLKTGEATASIADNEAFHVVAPTACQGKGAHTLMFANVDDQLLLWVDGDLAEFKTEVVYSGLRNELPTPANFSPAGIAVSGANVTARHLRVYRDIYYIADRSYQPNIGDYLTDYRENPYLFPNLTSKKLVDFLSDPSRWQPFMRRKSEDFELREEQYLTLGDNSPNSQDGRFWADGNYWVDQPLMIGQAMFVYWPHAWETPWYVTIPGTEIRVPCYPNFSQMRRID